MGSKTSRGIDQEKYFHLLLLPIATTCSGPQLLTLALMLMHLAHIGQSHVTLGIPSHIKIWPLIPQHNNRIVIWSHSTDHYKDPGELKEILWKHLDISDQTFEVSRNS